MLIPISATKKDYKEYKNVPAGLHLARLYKTVDLGTQYGEYQGKATQARKVIFYFEMHSEDETGAPLVNDDGKPLIITKYYNATLAEKATLRKHLQAWLNLDFENMKEGFDSKQLLGKFAMLNVTTYVKDGKTRSSVESLTAVPAVVAKHGLPEGVNDIFQFELDKFDSDKFALLSDGVRNIIMDSPEYRKLTNSGEPAKQPDNFNDDIPF